MAQVSIRTGNAVVQVSEWPDCHIEGWQRLSQRHKICTAHAENGFNKTAFFWSLYEICIRLNPLADCPLSPAPQVIVFFYLEMAQYRTRLIMSEKAFDTGLVP